MKHPEEYQPANRPFALAVANGQIDPEILEAAQLANAAIDAAKRILLQNRVQNFEASDVVNLARLIIENSLQAE